MTKAMTALAAIAIAGTASAQVYTGGGFSISGEDQRDENIDITGLVFQFFLDANGDVRKRDEAVYGFGEVEGGFHPVILRF